VKNSKKLFVKRYVPGFDVTSAKDTFATKVILITVLICVILICVALSFAAKVPREVLLNSFKKDKPADAKVKITQYIYPEPTEEIRIKAERLKEIRYEEYLEKSYKPNDGEIDTVYVYDNKKKCYLTFDDGPSTVTPAILDVLNQYGVKATFFVMGKNAEANPKIIKSILSEGHAIGNHSYSHNYAYLYSSPDSFRDEVKKCRDAINKAIGTEYDNLVFRFPGGYESLTDEDTKAAYRMALKNMGYRYVDWSCLTGDSETTTPAKDYLMDTLKATISSTPTGDIVVLMHDSSTKQITAETLPLVIEYISSLGYEFDIIRNS